MGRFSDSPYHLLKAFFDGLNNTEGLSKPINDWAWDVEFVSRFDEPSGSENYGSDQYTFTNTENKNDSIIFTDYRTTAWNREEYYDGNLLQTFNSYIVAPFINISGKGGGIMDLFVKEEDVGFWYCLKNEEKRVFKRREEMIKYLKEVLK